jgi:hypothetical protein
MGQGIVNCHAKGTAYRALVLCPNQLVKKWAREVRETVPNAVVRIIKRADLLDLYEMRRRKPTRPEWYIIARDEAKLGAAWRGACGMRKKSALNADGVRYTYDQPVCPDCGKELYEYDKAGVLIGPIDPRKLDKNKAKCEGKVERNGRTVECGASLWQETKKVKRFEPARFIARRLRGFFKYLILDEVHELSAENSAQGNAAASLIAATRYAILMTGTLLNGKAGSIRPLLWRAFPKSMTDDGFEYKESTAFVERYGRFEIITTRKESTGGGWDNRMSRGNSSSSTRKNERPGIMPTLFGRHLIGNAVFLGLGEMGAQLPPFEEHLVPVEMGDEQEVAYRRVQNSLQSAVREMVAKGDKRLLGTMLMTLLKYPDHPFGWETVGYRNNGTFMPVCQPPNLSDEAWYPKERELLRICRQEKLMGRQVWVYCLFNGEHDVQSRIARLLTEAKFRVKVLPKEVPPIEREEWIAKHGKEVDVMISHPKLVETGLELFDKGYLGHNFVSLVFFETGYQLSTLRQASRRSYRIGQLKPCKVFYMYYQSTLQEAAVSLMGKKLAAAEALEGKFSSEGLIAMSEDDSLEMALAKSLADSIGEDARRSWEGVEAEEPELVCAGEVL